MIRNITIPLKKLQFHCQFLRAEQAIIQSKRAYKDKEDANKDELKELLAYAKEQLLLAQALGYGKVEKDYAPILEEIEKIESILKSDDSTKDIFENLKEKISSFLKDFNKVKSPTKMPQANK